MKINSRESYVSPQCECVQVNLDGGGMCTSMMSSRGIDELNEDNSSASYIWN